MSNTTTPTVRRLPEFKINGKGKLTVSKELSSQIVALHASCGNDEWSGILIFKPIVENLIEPSKFIAEAIGVYPMHYGNPGYTEYSVGTEILDVYEKYPEADPSENENPTLRLGQIHSHHGMAAFFSGTDDSELRDNAEKYDYYLSLIVNFNGKYCAKVAFHATIPQSMTMKGGKTQEAPPKEVMAVFELEIIQDTTDWFKDRVSELEDTQAAKKYHSATTYGTATGTSRPSGRSYDEHEDFYSNMTVNKNDEKGSESKKADGKETKNATRKTSAVGSVGLVSSEAIRKALPSLFIEDENVLKEIPGYFWVWDRHPLKDGTPFEIEQYVARLISRLEPWMDENFGEEIVMSHGTCEVYIMNKILDLVSLYKIGYPLADAAYKGLQAYYQVMYNGKEV